MWMRCHERRRDVGGVREGGNKGAVKEGGKKGDKEGGREQR